jgi:NAD-dependent SIR2 family protein deacetylase
MQPRWVPMPECQNCGSFVSRDYVRVFAPEGFEDARVCPQCEDAIREGAAVREARSRRVSSL